MLKSINATWSEICDEVYSINNMVEIGKMMGEGVEAGVINVAKTLYRPDFLFGFEGVSLADLIVFFVYEEDGTGHAGNDPINEAGRRRTIIFILQQYVGLKRFQQQTSAAKDELAAATNTGNGQGCIQAQAKINRLTRTKTKIIKDEAERSSRIIVSRYVPGTEYTTAAGTKLNPNKAVRLVIVRTWTTWALDILVYAETAKMARAALPNVLIMYLFYNFNSIHLKFSRAMYSSFPSWDDVLGADAGLGTGTGLGTGLGTDRSSRLAQKAMAKARAAALNGIGKIPVVGTTIVASTVLGL
jgi:hypothetical protein